MMETRELRTRWNTCRQNLLKAEYNHADEELARTLHFATKNPLIAGILNVLRAKSIYAHFDVDTWLSGRGPANVLGAGRTNLGFSLDDSERAAQCLKLLEYAMAQFQDGHDALFKVGNTTYGGRGASITDSIHSAIQQVFDPFYQYVDAELRIRETLVTPVDIMQDIQQLVDTDAALRYPETHRLLLDAYRQLFSLAADSSGETWNSVGYCCRHILIRFADEVFDPSFIPTGIDTPKDDDADTKLKFTVRNHLRKSGTGDRFRERIEGIIKANWDFVATFGHRQGTATERQARLSVIYTYLTIWLVDDVIKGTIANATGV